MRSARFKSSRSAGFTLIEALVTIAVLMVSLPAIVVSFNLASRIAISTKQKAEAVAIAQSRMDYLIATYGWQTGDGMTYEETQGNTVFNCQATLTDWEEATLQQLQNVQRLDVSVTWRFENNPQEVIISTVVYQPDSSTQTSGGALR